MGNQASSALPEKNAVGVLREKTQTEGVVLACRCRTPVPSDVMDRYWSEVDEVYSLVRRSVKQSKGKKKLGVVLDIDDTSLWCSCPSCSGEDSRIKTTRPEPIQPMKILFDLLRKCGVHVCFVSARREGQRPVTEGQLMSAGFRGFTDLILVPDVVLDNGGFKSFEQVVQFKVAARYQFVQRHDVLVLATVGDQQWDIVGPSEITGYRSLLRQAAPRTPITPTAPEEAPPASLSAAMGRADDELMHRR